MNYVISILEREIVSLTNVKDYYLKNNQNYIAQRYSVKIGKIQSAISVLKSTSFEKTDAGRPKTLKTAHTTND